MPFWTSGLPLQYLVIKNALSDETVAELNDTFERQLRDEKPEGALSWYLNRERDHIQADGTLSPRTLWHNDLILPDKVEPVLTELCSSFEWVSAVLSWVVLVLLRCFRLST